MKHVVPLVVEMTYPELLFHPLAFTYHKLPIIFKLKGLVHFCKRKYIFCDKYVACDKIYAHDKAFVSNITNIRKNAI